MDKARHDALLDAEENENQGGSEGIRRQVASSRGRLLQRADVARDVDEGESPAHNAYKNDEPEEFLRETLLLPKGLFHQGIPPSFTVTPPSIRLNGNVIS